MQLFKIPRDTTIARRWLDACGFEHISISPLTSTFKVCREHFTPSDFEGPSTLRSNAVPSLFTAHSRSLMDKQNSSPTKRFRSDMANIRLKQTITPMNCNKQRLTQSSYRNNNDHRQQESDNQALSLSSTYENFDDSFNEMKQINELDLNMSCFEEQLSDIQREHFPVKVSLSIQTNLISQ